MGYNSRVGWICEIKTTERERWALGCGCAALRRQLGAAGYGCSREKIALKNLGRVFEGEEDDGDEFERGRGSLEMVLKGRSSAYL